TAGIGAGEVIAAAGEAGIAGAEVLVVESGAAVGAALRGLDIGEAGAELGLRGPVDLTLPAGDILPVQAGGLSGGGSEGGGAGTEGGRAEHPSAQQRSEEHTSELQSRFDLVWRLLLEKQKPGPMPSHIT